MLLLCEYLIQYFKTQGASMKKFFILAMLASSAGLLHAQGYNNSQNQYGSRQQYGNQSQYNYQYGQGQYGQSMQYGDTSDQSLTSQIQNTLSSSQYQGKYNNVNASVNSGNVTLTGTVNSQNDKDSLGSIIGGINGIRSVNNQVQVQGMGQGQGYRPCATTTSPRPTHKTAYSPTSAKILIIA
jgi:osmotically-inducible protein OsmY